jgi:predicted DNA-binding protein YlxM (UPF0122 family)
MNEMDKIMAEMAELKRVDDAAEKNDVIKRTLSKLLTIEKKATYGTVSGGKNKLLDKEILAELKNYKEEKNAS